MRKFLSKVFYFLVLILLFNLIVFNFSKKNYFDKYLEVPEKSYSSFIFADSHGLPLTNFSSDYGVYNFSKSSDSYLDMKRKIVYLLDNGYTIHTIYITVDDHTLSYYRERLNNEDRSAYYLPKKNFSEKLNYLNSFYMYYYFPIVQPKIRKLVKHYMTEMTFGNIGGDDSDEVDWGDLSNEETRWDEISEENKQKISSERIESQFLSKDTSDVMRDALLDIIALSEKNNINLIGIKFPLTQTYLNELGANNYGADHIFENHQIKVLDYRDLFIKKDGYFKDPDHLNTVGGEAFSKVLFE